MVFIGGLTAAVSFAIACMGVIYFRRYGTQKTHNNIPWFRCHLLYGMVFKYLYSALQRPWANRCAFGSISSKKRDKF